MLSLIYPTLGLNYHSHSPEFIEALENKEEILIERESKARITEKYILVGIDESTMKTGIKTKTQLQQLAEGRIEFQKIKTQKKIPKPPNKTGQQQLKKSI